MHFVHRLLAVLLIIPALARRASAAEAPAPDKPSDKLFLWKVTPKAGKNVVYLLGSIHAGSADFYPLPDEIEDAYAECQVLAVEVDLAAQDQEALQQLMMDKGVYGGNDTLSRHLPRQTYERVSKYASGLGLPAVLSDRLRPWALNVMVTMLEAQQAGLKPELGIDQHFLDLARQSRGKEKKEVVELESAEDQLNLLASFPDKQQAGLLDATLEGAGHTKEAIEKLVEAWKAGDADAMHRITAADPVKKRPALRPVFQKLVDERNVTMARKVEGYLKGRKAHFVVVGAGHLSGPNSIPRLLEKRGYKVEQVRRKAEVPAPEGANLRDDEEKGADVKGADVRAKTDKRKLVPSR
jgi:uncharacterized protein YbaP (TraB family)